MISRATIFRIIFGFIGLISVILIFWIGAYYHWRDVDEIIMALLFATTTVLIELIITFEYFNEGIKKIFPSLEIPIEEQIHLSKLILDTNELKKKREDPYSLIVLSEFEYAKEIIHKAKQDIQSDFIFNDIYKANSILLNCLKRGQTFKALSAFSKPELWEDHNYMTEYLKLNYKLAASGVNIERIFLFTDDDCLVNMNEILREQKKHNIKVYYAIKKEIFEKGYYKYPNYSYVEDINIGIFASKEEIFSKVTITKRPEIIGELANQFENIKKNIAKEIEIV